MSTHNISFCAEIRKILVFFARKNAISGAMVHIAYTFICLSIHLSIYLYINLLFLKNS